MRECLRLSYATSTATYCTNNSITPNIVSGVTGGGTITYSVSSALPNGLSIDPNSGTISGTPTTVSGASNYTVTATNGCSNTTKVINITVIANVSSLSYSSPTATYCTGNAITQNTPTVSGGGTITYTVSPALPSGLSLSSTTGKITGTPNAASAAANYTVTASNGCSSAQAVINITVITGVSALNYTTSPVTYCTNIAITPNTVSGITGGGTITYSVSPALPNGLSIDANSGTISGTPTAVTASKPYSVTATNGCSSTSKSLTIAVIAEVSSLSYSSPTATYCTGNAITQNTPTVSGGGTITYSVSPALPTGLNLSSTTGTITGTPSVATAATNYTVTASNECSSAQTVVNITVITGVSGLNYTTSSATYCTNIAITPNTVSGITGDGTITYSVSPALPNGLSIDPNTGEISGTPTAVTASKTYTVTATNSCSSTNTGLTIAVTLTPTVINASTKEICNGSSTDINLTATAPSTYSWTIGTIIGGITGANSGSGSSITDNLLNSSNSDAGSVEYIVTPTSTTGGCPGDPYTITVTVNPTPSVTTPATAEICNGTQTNINLTSSASSASSDFSWTTGTITGGITGASAGSGSTINQTLTNPSNAAAGSVEYLVTPTAGTCQGSSYSITVTVDPTPVVTTVNTKEICSGANTNISLDATASSSFAWSVGTITGGITGANSGSGTTISDILVDPVPSATGTVAYLVTPTSNTGSCSGAPYTITVTVDAPVVITADPTDVTSCSTLPVDLSVTATGTGLTYQWYKNGVIVSNTSNISGAQAATLHFNKVQTGNIGDYYVVVTGTDACANPKTSNPAHLAVNQQIVVNTPPASQAICTGSTATFTIDVTATAPTYQWRKGNTNLSDGTLGDGAVISGSQTATLTIANATPAENATTYNVVVNTPGAGCQQSFSDNVSLTVNPVPVVNTVTDKVFCNNTPSGNISFAGGPSGTVYNWSTPDYAAIGVSFRERYRNNSFFYGYQFRICGCNGNDYCYSNLYKQRIAFRNLHRNARYFYYYG